MNNYGSESDQQAANSALSNLRNIVGDSDQHVLDMIVSGLSTLIDVSSWTKHCLLSSISMSVLMYATIKGLLKANMTALTIPFFFLLLQQEKDVLAKQLGGIFLFEDAPLFGLEPAVDWISGQALVVSEESVPFDEVCHSQYGLLFHSC